MSQELTIWLHNNPYSKKSEAKPHSDAILQQLLQNTLNTSTTIEINKNDNGKPYTEAPVYFSHSNSGHLYAYVISTMTEVAIDLEIIKSERDVMQLAARYFHPNEWQHLQQLSSKKQAQKFYQLWTKKEAWCKLEGGNLWSYLRRSVLLDDAPKTQHGKLVHWTEITAIDGFAGMLASTIEIKPIWINNIA